MRMTKEERIRRLAFRAGYKCPDDLKAAIKESAEYVVSCAVAATVKPRRPNRDAINTFIRRLPRLV